MDPLFAIYCPICGCEVENEPPTNYVAPGPPQEYRHADDATVLCLVKTAAGLVPALPVEHALSTNAGR